MGHPTTTRIFNTDRLPLRRTSSGVWELRKRLGDGKRLEVSLGTKNLKVAEQRAAKILRDKLDAIIGSRWAENVADGMRPKGWLWRVHANVKHRMKEKGGSRVTLSTLESIALRSNGRCEVSGVPFYLGSQPRHPFKPSIDRVESSIGYDPENIRMVCLAVNYCMSHWGENIFHAIAAATTSKRLAELAANVVFPQKGGGKQPKPS